MGRELVLLFDSFPLTLTLFFQAGKGNFTLRCDSGLGRKREIEKVRLTDSAKKLMMLIRTADR